MEQFKKNDQMDVDMKTSPLTLDRGAYARNHEYGKDIVSGVDETLQGVN